MLGTARTCLHCMTLRVTECHLEQNPTAYPRQTGDRRTRTILIPLPQMDEHWGLTGTQDRR